MAQFQQLISQLSEDQRLKGRQFEKICRWYLENDPVLRHQVRSVWLWKDWPGRWGPDAGIDLVAETHAGKLWAVQAKAYAPSSSVTKADVDTFLSESSRAQFAMRLLLATTDRVSHNARRTIEAQEKPVHLVTASALSKAALNWPNHPLDLEAPSLSRNRPRPHQRLAVDHVLQGLSSADRGQLVMACGTGKTMVSLWVWEGLTPPTALVVLPSISLLAQTVREWCANARVSFDFLAVCSDESVTDADVVRNASELPFATTTDAEEVAAFLESSAAGHQVIFSTYHSTPRVAEAVLRTDGRLGLIVADEAHRCAGRVDGGFATILKDREIPAHKRLFMTATPRYLTTQMARAAGERKVEVVSMDDEAVFGQVLHKLTFGEAIANDLLTDYQVAIIGVDGREYLEMVQRTELVQSDDGAQTDARTLAAQAALLKGIAKYDLRRCVTFHSRVARAREFADSLTAIAQALPEEERPSGEIWADHVSGAMMSSSRDARLNRLRSLHHCDRALLANARCLGEGVDVPALDAVAFIDPRQSLVDIVQAVGRVMRKAPDKRLGTIMLPVFIEGDGDAVDAVSNSAFETVWRVLVALRAHDDVFAEQLDALRMSLGRNEPIELPAKIVVDLPAAIDNDFMRAFDVRLVEMATQVWHARYGLLQAFVKRGGHARVPRSHVESGFALGSWVGTQRHEFAQGRLSAERASLLEALPGWIWNTGIEDWRRGYEALQQFVQREGHAQVPQGHVESGVELGTWVGTQRWAHSKGTLSGEKVDRLEALPGWLWSVPGSLWERAFGLLEQYVEREGHARLPRQHVESGYALGAWITNQRTRHAGGRLRPDYVARLEAMPGWSWNVLDQRWQMAFEVLQQFVEREGHASVRQHHTESGFALGSWVSVQRESFSRKALRPERVALLEALPGWAWEVTSASWDRAIAALHRFAEREGHTRVPLRHREGGVALGSWVRGRRAAYAKGTLNARQVATLEALPRWSWDTLAERWSEAFCCLQTFVEREGHSRVPSGFTESGLALGSWVSTQRAAHTRGILSVDRVDALEALPGWSWSPISDRWHQSFELLVQFVRREGHARVPRSHRESGLALGAWVTTQKTRHTQGSLSPEKIALLEALPGWAWAAPTPRKRVSKGPRTKHLPSTSDAE